MTDYVSTALDSLVSTLRDNVEDPIHRSQGNWIYYGEFDDNAKSPSMYVMSTGERPGRMHIGSIVQPMHLTVAVFILVRVGQVGTIASTQYKDALLVPRILDQVYNTIETNSTSMTGIVSAIRINTPQRFVSYDPVSMLYYARALFDVYIWRS